MPVSSPITTGLVGLMFVNWRMMVRLPSTKRDSGSCGPPTYTCSRIFASSPDLDHVAGEITERPDARVPPDPDRSPLNHREKSDLDVVAKLDIPSHHNAAEADAHASADAVAQEPAVGQYLQRTRQPTKENEVPPGNARLGEEGFWPFWCVKANRL